MNLHKGSLNAACFRIDGKPAAMQLALRRGKFEPIKPEGDDERSAGFVEFERTDRGEFSQGAMQFGHYVLFNWRIDRLKVPAPALRKALLEWAQGFESKNGRVPGRVERAEQKLVLKRALRAKQEVTSKLFPVAINHRGDQCFIFAPSLSVIEEVQAVLESVLEVRLLSRAVDQLQRIKDHIKFTTAADADGAREMLDRGALGRACLTWLLWRSESTEPILAVTTISRAQRRTENVSISFFGKAALCGVASEVATAKVTGTTAPYAPLVKQALKRGLLVDEARVKVTKGEQEFEVTLDAKTFTLKAAKLPASVFDAPDERLLQRIDMLGVLASAVEDMTHWFGVKRTSDEWPEIVAEMLAWMEGQS